MKFKNAHSCNKALLLGIILILVYACNKDDSSPVIPDYLEVNFPGMEYRHDMYYHLDHNSRSIEVLFDEQINPGTIAGNIKFSDKNGSLDSKYNYEIAGNLVMLRFNKDFILNDGWKYYLEISSQVKSITGHLLPQTEIFDLRTTASHVFKVSDGKNKSGIRNAIACISDVHMGDKRANEGKYSWFGQNKDAMEDFLDTVYQSDYIRQLVIMGDLFDEWIVPCSVSPIDPDAGINNSADYFNAIATAETNAGIIQRLKNIAADTAIELIYIPGNHDML
nr:hypothetical protein [Bacteroidota bacterium]